MPKGHHVVEEQILKLRVLIMIVMNQAMEFLFLLGPCKYRGLKSLNLPV